MPPGREAGPSISLTATAELKKSCSGATSPSLLLPLPIKSRCSRATAEEPRDPFNAFTLTPSSFDPPGRYRQEKQRILSRQPGPDWPVHQQVPSGVLPWGSQHHVSRPVSPEPSRHRGNLEGAQSGFFQQRPSEDRPGSHWQCPQAHGGQEEASHRWRRVRKHEALWRCPFPSPCG